LIGIWAEEEKIGGKLRKKVGVFSAERTPTMGAFENI
jgi:hypothetical protein